MSRGVSSLNWGGGTPLKGGGKNITGRDRVCIRKCVYFDIAQLAMIAFK